MKVNRRVALVSSIGVAVVAGTCWIVIPRFLFHYSVDVVGFPPLHYPGFQTWPTLRDFDGPGTVFTVRDGAFDVVGKTSVAPTLAGNEVLGELRSSGDWNANVLEKFLGPTLRIEAKSRTNIEVQFQPEGVQRWRIISGEVTTQVNEIAKRHKDVPLFLIAESISVREITYGLSSGTLLQAEPSLQKDQFGTLEMKRSDKEGSQITIVRKFDKPFYLFYRPQKVNILRGLVDSQILFTDLDLDLRWSQEVRHGGGEAAQ
jgi:hypothetical protein